ncbi:MAG: nitroreductase family protein, partial [Ruthenibacterium sp.]
MKELEMIMTRRSVRRFTGEAVSASLLEQIVRAGMSGPSAHGRRPCHIVTVEAATTRAALKPLCRWWQMLDKAAVVMVVCTDTALCTDMNSEYQVDDGAAACENMLLAAHALGLGGVWLGACESDENGQKVKKALAIPKEMRLIAMLALGHPKEQPEQTERFNDQQ